MPARSRTKHDHMIGLRLTAEEYEHVQLQAAAAAQSLSSYARAAVMSDTAVCNDVQKLRDRAADAQLYDALRQLDRHFYCLANLIKMSDPAASAMLSELHAASKQLLDQLSASIRR